MSNDMRPDTKYHTDIDPLDTLKKLKKQLTNLDDERRYVNAPSNSTGATTVVINYRDLTNWIFLLNVLEDTLKMMEFKKT